MQHFPAPARCLAAGAVLLFSAAALAQPEPYLEAIDRVAITQQELPAGWTLLEDRVDDPLHFTEVSTLISLMGSLAETGSVNLGHAVSTPAGAFNIEYFAFARPEGATTGERYIKEAARKNNWLSFRLGDIVLLAATTDTQAHELLVNRRLVPFLERLLAESLAAEQQGNLAAAEQGYFAVVQTAPVYAQAWLRLGTIYQRSNPPKTTAALEAYRKAVDANRQSPSLSDLELWQALVGLGRTSFFEGNTETAMQVLEEARALGERLGPEQEAKSHYFLAALDVRQNDEDRFVKRLETAFELEKKTGKRDLLEMAAQDPLFEAFRDKKKFKRLLKKYGKG
jgi:tetratricopeptide (TPR) repeat protein